MRRKSCQAFLILLSLGLLAGLVLFLWKTESPPPPGLAAVRLVNQAPRTAPSFVEVSTFFGPRDISSTWGVSWSDIDSDGDMDLFAAVHMHYPSTLWINDNGQFLVRCSTFSGGETGLDDHMGLWSDFDGDGDPDLYTANGYHRKDRLLRAEGDAKYQDVTDEAGTTFGDRGRGRSAIGADLTGNGFDDLVVLNYNTPNFLYRNLGNGRFEECGESHGVADALPKIGAVAGDLDGDGDIDLYIPIFAGGVSNILLLNRGDGVFIDRSTGSGADIRGRCLGAAIGDVDGDGDLDIFVTRDSEQGHVLLRNDGNATFVDVSEKAGVNLTGAGMFNAGFADLDNDTDLDLFIACGGDVRGLNGKDMLLKNKGDGTFVDVSDDAGIQVSVRGNAAAVAFADYNQDGFVDFVVSNGYGLREIGGPLQLYRNRGLPSAQKNAGHWLWIRTERDRGSREAGGARVQVRLPDGRILTREAGGARAMAQDQPGVHLGIATAKFAEEVCVDWPNGSHTQMQGVPADCCVIVAARSQPRYVGSHPAALLGRVQTFALETAAEKLRQHLAADRWTKPSQEEITTRRRELIAYVIADEACSKIEISDQDIQSAYEHCLDFYKIPKRYFIEQLALGKFTTFRQQQPLPWPLANRLKEQFRNGDDAFKIAAEADIRAFEGGERGYLEMGWFTEDMLRERYGDFADKLIRSRTGQVRGPAKIKEGLDIQDENLVWPVLRIFRVGPQAGEVIIDRGLVEQDLVRGIQREKLRRLFKRYGALALPSTPPSEQGVVWGVRYDLGRLAAQGQTEGFLEREPIQHAFSRIEREVRLDSAVRQLLGSREPTDSDIEAHMMMKRDEWTRPAQVEGTLLCFPIETSAQQAKEKLDAGVALTSVMEDLDIPSRQTRNARNNTTYHLHVRLDAERTRRRLGEGAFEKLLQVEPGRCSEVFRGIGGFYVVVVDSHHGPEPLADSHARIIARRELKRRQAGRLLRSILRQE